ncbi:unnamed protein product [Linum trigynum]|uniref:Uncharacterized protein n=1 Tax=Linum trigynum TaxID=586398 RepID=A0AAV2FDY9_9ROSI
MGSGGFGNLQRRAEAGYPPWETPRADGDEAVKAWKWGKGLGPNRVWTSTTSGIWPTRPTPNINLPSPITDSVDPDIDHHTWYLELNGWS